MQSVIEKIESKHKKHSVVSVKSGDTVRVHQKIVEGKKERVQVFEGLVIKVGRTSSLTSTFTVRRVASGIGVEKTFLIHSPSIIKVEIVRRSKVRRNYLSYMRERTGKSARLSGVEFDREAVNKVAEKEPEAEIVKTDAEAIKAAHEEFKAADVQSEKANEPKVEKTEADKLEDQPKERASAKGPAAEQNKEK
jgi:large subunit ribosomal protein L19